MDREKQLFEMMCSLAATGTPCDICTYSGPVHLDAVFDTTFFQALMYGAGANAMRPILSALKVETPAGSATVSLADIWIIAPMPKGGISESELADVDLAQGDVPAGDSGKTIKEVVAETYRPKNQKEHEYYLRRFLAS